MQQHVGQVVAPGLGSEKLLVQHQRPHRQRMPVAGHRVKARPGDVLQGKTLGNVSVPGDVDTIVELNKMAAQRGQKHPDHQHK